MGAAAAAATRPGRGPGHAPRGRASGRATRLSQNFLADTDVLEADPRRGRPRRPAVASSRSARGSAC